MNVAEGIHGIYGILKEVSKTGGENMDTACGQPAVSVFIPAGVYGEIPFSIRSLFSAMDVGPRSNMEKRDHWWG